MNLEPRLASFICKHGFTGVSQHIYVKEFGHITVFLTGQVVIGEPTKWFLRATIFKDNLGFGYDVSDLVEDDLDAQLRFLLLTTTQHVHERETSNLEALQKAQLAKIRSLDVCR